MGYPLHCIHSIQRLVAPPPPLLCVSSLLFGLCALQTSPVYAFKQVSNRTVMLGCCMRTFSPSCRDFYFCPDPSSAVKNYPFPCCDYAVACGCRLRSRCIVRTPCRVLKNFYHQCDHGGHHISYEVTVTESI